MGRHHHSTLFLRALLLIVVSFTGASTKKGWDAAPASAQDTPATADKPDFVGSETCQACHEDIYNTFVKSPHHRVEITPKLGYPGRGCEACHGMGSLHAGSGDATLIRNPAKLAAAAIDQICLK